MTPDRWCWLRRSTFVACLLVLVPALSAFAQQQPLLNRPLPGARVPGQPEPQMPLRAPITLTPWIGVAEEYDDNVLMDNTRKTWDLVTVLTPGVTFTAERPTWRFNADYNFDARLYAREPRRNNGFNRQSFELDSFYRLDPQVTLSLDDSFRFNTGVNAFSTEGVVTGRDQSWSNTIRPGATWQIDRQTSARAFGAWTTQNYERGELRDSDTYRGDLGLEHAFTTRLRGNVGYQYAYFAIQDAPNVTTHAPRIGLAYDFTPTLTGSIAGGPTFEVPENGDSRVTPAIAASLVKRYAWGEAAARYNREVGTAGGLGGTADNQTAGISVTIGTLLRGLTVDFAPQYRVSESDDNTIDVRTLTIPLRATYQITAYFAVQAGYAFLHQRSDSTLRSARTGELLARDVDQNRVYIGIVVGYPIRWD